MELSGIRSEIDKYIISKSEINTQQVNNDKLFKRIKNYLCSKSNNVGQVVKVAVIDQIMHWGIVKSRKSMVKNIKLVNEEIYEYWFLGCFDWTSCVGITASTDNKLCFLIIQ